MVFVTGLRCTTLWTPSTRWWCVWIYITCTVTVAFGQVLFVFIWVELNDAELKHSLIIWFYQVPDLVICLIIWSVISGSAGRDRGGEPNCASCKDFWADGPRPCQWQFLSLFFFMNRDRAWCHQKAHAVNWFSGRQVDHGRVSGGEQERPTNSTGGDLIMMVIANSLSIVVFKTPSPATFVV